MGIILSPKHGVNPSIARCFFCLESSDTLFLCGRLPGDAEAPRDVVWNLEPCGKCEQLMQQGVIVIGVRDGEFANVEREQAKWQQQVDALSSSERRRAQPFVPNPFRTGLWCVVTDEAIKRLMTAAGAERIIRCRWTFIEDHTAEQLGLKQQAQEMMREQPPTSPPAEEGPA
jgi:hypothetical protein